MPEIKDFLVAVPAPVSIGVGEMAFAGAVEDSGLQAFTNLVSIRVGMGMDTGAVAGKSDAVIWNKPFLQGRDEGSETEKLLEPFFIMEGKFFMRAGVNGHGVSDPCMFIWEFLTFAGLFGKL